ncbi:MAG: glycoside hydrolase family 26 protein [Acidimicrobiia bacterium]
MTADRPRRLSVPVALAAAVLVTAIIAVAVVRRGDVSVGNVQVPPSGVLLGAHVQAEARSEEAGKAAVEALEADIGRFLDIDHIFYPWDEPFPTGRERWDVSHGRVPMISWNGRGVRASEIAAGSHNGVIAERAVNVKALRKPVLIRWFWEMDGKKKAEWAESPEAYIAAWQRIHNVFDDEGANNVSWVWCPNASAFADGSAQRFYPGDRYVDFICADGYNWAPGREGDPWRSFGETFSAFHAWGLQQDKPLMVGEYGVQERADGEKAAWLRDAKESLKSEFRAIRAVVYFDANRDYDWRVRTSPSAMAAFREMATDPWFTVTDTSRRRPRL